VVEGKHPAQPIVPPAVAVSVATVLVIGAFLPEGDHGAVEPLVAQVG